MPRVVLPTIVGHQKQSDSNEANNLYIGDEAISKRDFLDLKYPIERGVIVHWDEMEKIWSHTFQNLLPIDPKDFNILLTEAPLNPRANREKIVELMFEKFNFQGTYISLQAVLSMFALGRTTGLVVVSKNSGSDSPTKTPSPQKNISFYIKFDFNFFSTFRLVL